jgi:hypothetical protein
MAETDTAEVRVNESAGHLSVHVEGAHPREIQFSFEQQQQRIPSALAGSLASHIVLALLVIFGVRYGGATAISPALLPEQPNTNIIWLSQPGPGGGGGGGGNRMKEPPRQAELPGKDKITVPVTKPPKMEMQEVKKEPDPVAQLNIPAKSLAAAQDSLPGAIEAPPGPPTLSQGSGTGGGAGTGSGMERARVWAPAAAAAPAVVSTVRAMALPCRACSMKSARSTPLTRCARKSRAPCFSSASSVLMAASATSRSSARSIRRSASTNRQSSPPGNGASRLALASAKRCRFSSR